MASGDSNKGTIIAAIIAVVGIIAIPFLNMAIPYVSGPILHYVIIPNSDGRTAKISVGNYGISAATNVTLTVIAPEKILQIQSTFSTDEIQRLSFNGTTMKAFIPKIIQGPGSLVEINLLIDAPLGSSNSNYTGYATYAQGSATSHTTDVFSDVLEKYSWMIILLYSYVIFYIFSLVWVTNRSKLRRLIHGLIILRNNFKNNSNDISSSLKLLPNRNATSKLIFEIPDYILIEDFYELLKKRESLQNNDEDKVVQNQLNKECLASLELVLKIDWKKYQKSGLRYAFIVVGRQNLLQEFHP